MLTRRAAEQPRACELYEQGVAADQSFDQIERVITQVLPKRKTPMSPRNVSWVTVRARDFPNPEGA